MTRQQASRLVKREEKRFTTFHETAHPLDGLVESATYLLCM